MSTDLSPQHEAFIRNLVESGVYPSRDKVIEAGLDALHQVEEAQSVPTEHEPLLAEAGADVRAGRVVSWNPDDFLQRLQQRQAANSEGRG